MSTGGRPDSLSALTPVTDMLRAIFGTDALPGLAPGLVVSDEAGWLPATELVDGRRLDDLLRLAARRWAAPPPAAAGGGPPPPPAAAALAWKAYTYWLVLPVVLGWLSARRVPLADPADTLIRLDDDGPLITVGMRRSARVAVLPGDPLAGGPLAGGPLADTARTPAGGAERTPPGGAERTPPGGAGTNAVRVVRDEAELLAELRRSLLDAHLNPLLAAIHARVRVGARTLLGSVAASVAYGVLLAGPAVSGPPAAAVGTLLGALDADDLIELVPGTTGGLAVRRRTCCLAFTLPRPKLCADCCVHPSHRPGS